MEYDSKIIQILCLTCKFLAVHFYLYYIKENYLLIIYTNIN